MLLVATGRAARLRDLAGFPSPPRDVGGVLARLAVPLEPVEPPAAAAERFVRKPPPACRAELRVRGHARERLLMGTASPQLLTRHLRSGRPTLGRPPPCVCARSRLRTAFPGLVPVIVGRCADEQMGGIATESVVAVVEDMQARGNRSVVYFPRRAVRPRRYAASPDRMRVQHAVSRVSRPAHELPAFVRGSVGELRVQTFF